MPVAVDLRILGGNIRPVGSLAVTFAHAFCPKSWRA